MAAQSRLPHLGHVTALVAMFLAALAHAATVTYDFMVWPTVP